MTMKTLAAAATLAVFASTGVNAATFDFSFDTSTATSVTTLTAVGTLDINVAPGSAFTAGDISNVSILIDGFFLPPTLLTETAPTAGFVSSDGSKAIFTTLSLVGDPSLNLSFGCLVDGCTNSRVWAFGSGGRFELVTFNTPAAALGSFQATAQVSAVPLPAGGLLLLSALGGVAAFKRRKKRAA